MAEGRTKFALFVCGLMLAATLAVAGQSTANPGVDLGGPYGGPGTFETTTITFKATSDDPALIFWRWNFDNDSLWDTPWRLSLTMRDSLSRLYCDDYHDVVLVEAWDGFSTKIVIIDGEPVVVPDAENDTARVDVNNVPPIVTLGGPYIGYAGRPIRFRAVGVDPGCDDLTFIWVWGDGSGEMHTHYFDAFEPEVVDERLHTYEEAGTYTVDLLLLDDDGGFTMASASVFVRPPLGDIDDLIDYAEGQPIPRGIKRSLTAQLYAARGALARDQDDLAVRMLGVFIHRVIVLSRVGKLTQNQAQRMTSSAQGIIGMIVGS